MCGIVAIIGKHRVAPLLVDALKRLEYRGYDSAGVATLQNGMLDRRRAEGKLVNLEKVLAANPLGGTIGIGHTRWATHGAPTSAGAHFSTETDTEVIAQLLASLLRSGKTPKEAMQATLSSLKGAYALAVLFEGENEQIMGARNGPPLAIGHGDGEMFIGSDAIALSPFTDDITYLEDGDWAILHRLCAGRKRQLPPFHGKGNL